MDPITGAIVAALPMRTCIEAMKAAFAQLSTGQARGRGGLGCASGKGICGLTGRDRGRRNGGRGDRRVPGGSLPERDRFRDVGHHRTERTL